MQSHTNWYSKAVCNTQQQFTMGNSPSLYSSDNESDMLDWGLEWCGSPLDEKMSPTNPTLGEQEEDPCGIPVPMDDNDENHNVTKGSFKVSRTTFPSPKIDHMSSFSTPRRSQPKPRGYISYNALPLPQRAMDETPKRSNISSHTKSTFQDANDDEGESVRLFSVFHSPRTAFAPAAPLTKAGLETPPGGRVTPDEEMDDCLTRMHINNKIIPINSKKDDDSAKLSSCCSSYTRGPLKKRLVCQTTTNDTATTTTGTLYHGPSITKEQHSAQAHTCRQKEMVDTTLNDGTSIPVSFPSPPTRSVTTDDDSSYSNDRPRSHKTINPHQHSIQAVVVQGIDCHTAAILQSGSPKRQIALTPRRWNPKKRSQYPFSSKKPKLYHRKYLPALKALAAASQKSTNTTTTEPQVVRKIPPVLDPTTPLERMDKKTVSILQPRNLIDPDRDEMKLPDTLRYGLPTMDHMLPEQHCFNSIAGSLGQIMNGLKVVDENMETTHTGIDISSKDWKHPEIKQPSAFTSQKLSQLVQAEVAAADPKEPIVTSSRQPMDVVIGSPHVTANYPISGNRCLLDLCYQKRFSYFRKTGDPLLTITDRHKQEVIQTLLYDMECQQNARFLRAESLERMRPDDVVMAIKALMNLLPRPNDVIFLPFPTKQYPNGLVFAPDMFIAMLSGYYGLKHPTSKECVRDIQCMRTYSPIRFVLTSVDNALQFHEVDETNWCLVQWYMSMATNVVANSANHDEESLLQEDCSTKDP